VNYQRFTGRNAREAMTKVRAALGADAIIVRNRTSAEGVEILAIGDADLPVEADPAKPATGAAGKTAMVPGTLPDPAATPMSTLTFQQYVRDRAAAASRPAPAAPQETPHDAAPQVHAAAAPQLHAAAAPAAPAAPAPAGDMLYKLEQMHAELARQLSSLAWMNLRHRDPIRTQLLRSLIDCGFSGALARLR
jgi:flagellar biosynthesis protein FlhF